ncbi:MAG: hypothetical protein BWZ10_03263 [candidate division BRC1 bacterium ADurb.BinA364]|nr:MAG: hypothetical protein BWZ10_03263 [candidate division BRC1 bacterium ADurb.BinA364]
MRPRIPRRDRPALLRFAARRVRSAPARTRRRPRNPLRTARQWRARPGSLGRRRPGRRCGRSRHGWPPADSAARFRATEDTAERSSVPRFRRSARRGRRRSACSGLRAIRHILNRPGRHRECAPAARRRVARSRRPRPGSRSRPPAESPAPSAPVRDRRGRGWRAHAGRNRGRHSRPRQPTRAVRSRRRMRTEAIRILGRWLRPPPGWRGKSKPARRPAARSRDRKPPGRIRRTPLGIQTAPPPGWPAAPQSKSGRNSGPAAAPAPAGSEAKPSAGRPASDCIPSPRGASAA